MVEVDCVVDAGRSRATMCRKRPFATHESADPAGAALEFSAPGGVPASQSPAPFVSGCSTRTSSPVRSPTPEFTPSNRARPANATTRPPWPHRPEPPAASAVVAATAGWSARALPASKTDDGGLTGCPEVDRRDKVDLGVAVAGLRDADELLHVPARSRCSWPETAAPGRPDASTVLSRGTSPRRLGLDAGELVNVSRRTSGLADARRGPDGRSGGAPWSENRQSSSPAAARPPGGSSDALRARGAAGGRTVRPSKGEPPCVDIPIAGPLLSSTMSVIAQAIADRQSEIDRLQAEIKALTDVEQTANAGHTTTMVATLVTAAEQVEAVLPAGGGIADVVGDETLPRASQLRVGAGPRTAGPVGGARRRIRGARGSLGFLSRPASGRRGALQGRVCALVAAQLAARVALNDGD